MKKLIATMILAVSAVLPLSATQYTFEDFTVKLSGAGVESLQLGYFAHGFVATAANTSEWAVNWTTVTVPDSTGYYDPSGPEWSVSLALPDNSVFAAGSQLYLWAYDTQIGSGSAWGLFADASWLIGINEGLDGITHPLDFTAASTAVFGSLDWADGVASTRIVTAGGGDVPDSVSSGLLLSVGLLALFGLRRKTGPSVI